MKMAAFGDLNVGDTFYDPMTEANYTKVCGNAAELLSGNTIGQLVTFYWQEEVQLME
jgi:hypothetical protein